jgi:hypothetical protein
MIQIKGFFLYNIMFIILKTIFWGVSSSISFDIISRIFGLKNNYIYRNIGFIVGCIRGYNGKTISELILN